MQDENMNISCRANILNIPHIMDEADIPYVMITHTVCFFRAYRKKVTILQNNMKKRKNYIDSTIVFD